MDYKNKYLKYKFKYSNLNKMNGGANLHMGPLFQLKKQKEFETELPIEEKNKLSILNLNCLQSDLLLGWSLYAQKNDIAMYFNTDIDIELDPNYNNKDSVFSKIEEKRNILKIRYLLENDSDIICLQEVDDIFLPFITKNLSLKYDIYINKYFSYSVNGSGIIPKEGYNNNLVNLVKRSIGSEPMPPLMDGNIELELFSKDYEWAKVKYNLTRINKNGKSIIICNVHTFWTMSIEIHNQLFIDFRDYLLKYLTPLKIDIQDIVIIGDFNRADSLQMNSIDNSSPNNDKLIKELFAVKEHPKYHVYPYNHSGNDYIFTGNNIRIKRHSGDIEPQPWFGSFSSGKLFTDLYYCMPLVNGFKDVVARFIQAHFNTPRKTGFKENVSLFLTHFNNSQYYDLVKSINFDNYKSVFKKKIETIFLEGKDIPKNLEVDGVKYEIIIDKTHILFYDTLYIKEFKDAFPGSGMEIYDYLIDLLQKRNYELWKNGQVLSDHLPISAHLEF